MLYHCVNAAHQHAQCSQHTGFYWLCENRPSKNRSWATLSPLSTHSIVVRPPAKPGHKREFSSKPNELLFCGKEKSSRADDTDLTPKGFDSNWRVTLLLWSSTNQLRLSATFCCNCWFQSRKCYGIHPLRLWEVTVFTVWMLSTHEKKLLQMHFAQQMALHRTCLFREKVSPQLLIIWWLKVLR